MKTIAFDVMGTDNGVGVAVRAGLEFLKSNSGFKIIFVGDQEEINKHINGHVPNMDIKHTTQVIDMTDGALAIRRKKDSSMVQAISMVKNKEADGVISAGSSAAVVATGFVHVGMIPGINRPAFMPNFPSKSGKGFVCLDVGANLENTPTDLHQFAVMGSVYMEKVRGFTKPRVALVNIGEEKGKGKPLQNEAYELIEKDSSLNFIGFKEPRYAMMDGSDVWVADGYTGNIMLKSLEGGSKAVSDSFKEAFLGGVMKKLLLPFTVWPLLKVKNKWDYRDFGGAMIIGLNGIVVKAHGSSDKRGWLGAFTQVKNAIEADVVNTLLKEFS